MGRWNLFQYEAVLVNWGGPRQLQAANVAPIHQKGWKENPGHCRPVSPTSRLGKVTQEIILSIMSSSEPLTSRRALKCWSVSDKGQQGLESVSYEEQLTELGLEEKSLVETWLSTNTWKEGAARLHPGKFMSGKISSLKEWLSIGTGFPGRWWSHHPWKCSENE